jgi:hypothetical protein
MDASASDASSESRGSHGRAHLGVELQTSRPVAAKVEAVDNNWQHETEQQGYVWSKELIFVLVRLGMAVLRGLALRFLLLWLWLPRCGLGPTAAGVAVLLLHRLAA